MATKKKAKKQVTEDKQLWKAVLFVLILAAAGYYGYTYFFSGSVASDNLVSVNGETITQAELDAAYATVPAQEQALLSKDDFLDQLIRVKLLLQKAKEMDFTADAAEVDNQLNLLKTQFPDDQAFEQFLTDQGLTMELLQQNLGQQQIINKLLEQEIISKIEVSDNDIQQFFNNNKESFIGKEGQMRAVHILVKTEEEANAISKELEEGADFKELAQERSIDVVSGKRGGELGFFSKEDVVPEFGEAAFALEEGETSQPVQTNFGWHIIKRENDEVTLEDVRDSIIDAIRNTKSQNALQLYMDQLVATADIVYGATETTPVKEEIVIPVKNDFKEKEGLPCIEDSKVVARLYSSANCRSCKATEEVFTQVVAEQSDIVKGKLWHLDTGDDMLTEATETALPEEEYTLYKEFTEKGAVPMIVLGCTSYRIGNAFSTFDAEQEKSELKNVLTDIFG